MKKIPAAITVRNHLLAILLAGLLTTPLTLISPSEADSAFWLGLSKMRLAVVAFQITGLLLVTVVLCSGWRSGFSSSFFKRLGKFFSNPDRHAVLRHTLLGLAVFSSIAFINFSILIPQALAAVSAWLALSLWTCYHLFIRLVSALANFSPLRLFSFLPAWKGLTRTQKRTTWVLLGLGLLYFVLFIPLNLRNSGSMQQLNLDESIMYPIVIKMLTAGEGLRASLYRFLVYGDYIYGFPFYGWSAFVLLPVKWLGGEGFAERLQLNMLLVRQLANVLPAVLSCFLFTWLATRFKNLWTSLGLNLILLTLPGMIGLNYTFWHPDGVNLFFVALTLYYLDRDRLRFGANFYFAALACGASIATRLFGAFFFLAIAVLLLMGWQKKTLTLRRGLLAGFFFILVMAAGIFISNPYMFAPGEIGAALNTLARRQAVLAQGVAGPDPEGIYRTGLDAWWPFMAPTFGTSLTLVFLAVSTLAGLFNRERRHFTWALFAWLLVIGTYMIATVKVKSPWYLLPFLIPLYCSTFNLPDLLRQKLALSSTGGQKKVWRIAVWILVAGLGAAQLVQNIHILGTSLIFQ